MRFAPVLMLLALGSCSPEGFEIAACTLNGRVAFRIHPIHGWLWDSQPRPNWILVRETNLGPHGAAPMWSARINDLAISEKRPSRELMLYGQVLPGWEVDVPARRLRGGTQYYALIEGGGRHGDTQFIDGDQLPKC